MKKIFLCALILALAVCSFACVGERKVVSVDFEGEAPETFDVDEPFRYGTKGVVCYEDGSTETFRIAEENVVGFSTSTTGEKTAKLVYKGVEKEFSYTVARPSFSIALRKSSSGTSTSKVIL